VKRICLILVFYFFAGHSLFSQLTRNEFHSWIHKVAGVERNEALATRVMNFYEHRNYTLAWIGNDSLLGQLVTVLQQGSFLGLDSSHYHYQFVKSLALAEHPLNTAEDSALADVTASVSAIHFFMDALSGSPKPALGYDGISEQLLLADVGDRISEAMHHGTFPQLLSQLEGKSPEYISGKRMLSSLLSGDTAASQIKGTNAKLPAPARIAALKSTLSTMRWLQTVRNQYPLTIVVNIPSCNLLVFSRDSIVLESRVVVGKLSTRTPTLASQVYELVMYPYWVVPHKIATKELLPLIQLNKNYFDANNFQLLDKRGRIVDHHKVDWKSLSEHNFPYTLRQSTGCDNSLGIVKLNFYSPYGVYLHDTPWKAFFNFQKRFFSHGCIRVQKATELARLVLHDNSIAIDTILQKGNLYRQKPLNVPLPEKVPVAVVYETAWMDGAGTIRFYEDVYNKIKIQKK
jgi:L,D-transpeptidase YcbB